RGSSRMLSGRTSTPTDGATDWTTENWPVPDVTVGSRRTAARVTPGAISLSSSTHFALKLYSNSIKPVALPPGRDRLSTKPEPTGSLVFVNTIGTVRVAWSAGPVVAPTARMTSGARATNSTAYLLEFSTVPAAQR